jgi:hypothetical protein
MEIMFIRRFRLLAVLSLVLPGLTFGFLAEQVRAKEAFDSGRASFAVRFNGQECPYRVFGVYVMPEETMTFETVHADGKQRYTVRAADGDLTAFHFNIWTWKAPSEPGLYPLVFTRQGDGDAITLNMFVLVPHSEVEQGVLNEFHIGEYPRKPYKGLAIYGKPKGFIEVTMDTADAALSPHFRLNQFLCKQVCKFPKYLVLRERLLLKLEYLLEEVNRRGYSADTFHVMSGYRTPHYNKGIGNVSYSRHMWGGAADIFIDQHPEDGMMDDLNGDGKITIHDAAILYNIVEELQGEPSYRSFIGGMGAYESTNAHGPFVHVDIRGFRARWGKLTEKPALAEAKRSRPNGRVKKD